MEFRQEHKDNATAPAPPWTTERVHLTLGNGDKLLLTVAMQNMVPTLSSHLVDRRIPQGVRPHTSRTVEPPSIRLDAAGVELAPLNVGSGPSPTGTIIIRSLRLSRILDAIAAAGIAQPESPSSHVVTTRRPGRGADEAPLLLINRFDRALEISGLYTAAAVTACLLPVQRRMPPPLEVQ